MLTASISFLPEGTYAIFKYVKNLAGKIKGVFIQPFLTIFFTKYSILLQKSKSVVNEFTKNLSSIINANTIIIIGSILVGDFVIDFIWGGNKFTKTNVELAFYFLIFNVLAILITSIGGIYRKMAVSHGKARNLYLFWSIAQLISAAFSYVLIHYFNVNGLFFIIPINGILLGLVSYLIYQNTSKAIKYNFKNFSNFIAVLLILFAAIFKYYFSNNTPFVGEYSKVLFFLMPLVLLSLYPIISTYRILRNETTIS